MSPLRILLRPRIATALLITRVCALAQVLSLSTSLSGTGAADGHLFDVVAQRTVTLCRVDMNLFAGTHTVEIWFRATSGSFQTASGSPGAWLLAGTTTVTSTGTGTATPIPVSLALPLAAGATQALYVTTTQPNGANSVHEIGTSVGSIAAQNADLRILEGASVLYPFTPIATPRRWNGVLHYAAGTAPTACPLYQTNQPAASMTLGGVQSNGQQPARTFGVPGSTVALQVAGTPGALHELAVTSSPLVSGLATPFAPQIVNVDLTAPSLGFLYGGAVPGFRPLVPINAPFGVPNACVLTSAQLFVIDFSTPGFFSLSQGVEFRVAAGGTPLFPQSLPAQDDGNLTVSFGCPTIPFYGTRYTQIHVSTNGRVLFTGPDTDFGPSIAEVLTDGPFTGYWNDFDLSAGGSASVHVVAPDLYEVRFLAVPHFTLPLNLSTFSILLDAADGSILLNGLQGIAPNTDPALLGITLGNLGATNSGPRVFSVGQNGNGLGTEALYDFLPAGTPAARPATLGNGVQILWFVPQGTNYFFRAF
jgi:hypothetical protein